MNHLKKTSGRVFLVAFLAATGLLASAAPGLATEQPDPVAPLTAASPAAPAQPTAAGPSAPTGDPDDESSASGSGWAGKNTSSADEEPGDADESGDSESGDSGRDSDDSDSDSDDSGRGDSSDDGRYTDQDDPSDEDSAVYYGTEKQTRAEKAAAERAAKKAKALQKKAQKKDKAAKKASSAKSKKAKQQAAKKMKQQAMRAAKQAAARAAAERAAEKRAAQQQRRAVADDEREESPRSGGGIDSLRDAILDLTNKARKSAGCGSVRYSTQLERSAQAHANDMAEHHYMSHQSRSGKNSDQRIRATGFNGDKTGENLGEGFSSPDAVFKAWMGSSSHRRNILDCGFRILGVGFNDGYWAQHFGG